MVLAVQVEGSTRAPDARCPAHRLPSDAASRRVPTSGPGGGGGTGHGPALVSCQSTTAAETLPRGRSAAGSASPCQGEGRGFESRRPLGGTPRVRAGPPGPGRHGGPGVPGGMAEWLRQGPAKPCTRVRFPLPPRAISSVGERFLDTEEVTGSIPVSPTTHEGPLLSRNGGPSSCSESFAPSLAAEKAPERHHGRHRGTRAPAVHRPDRRARAGRGSGHRSGGCRGPASSRTARAPVRVGPCSPAPSSTSTATAIAACRGRLMPSGR